MQPVFQTYHLMVAIGMALIALAWGGAFLAWRGTLFRSRRLLWIYVLAVLLPQAANQLGWASAEIGRQPWIVQGLMRTADAVSDTISAGPGAVLADPVHRSSTWPCSWCSSCCWTMKVRKGPLAADLGDDGGGGVMAGDWLNVVWYLLVGVLFTGYAILDGFDLGVGALHLLAKKDQDRRVFLNAIGPFWDGNQVWLVTGGGALFAAFPYVYATAFSGFYIAVHPAAVHADLPRRVHPRAQPARTRSAGARSGTPPSASPACWPRS